MDEAYTERRGTVLLAGSGVLVVRVERGADEDCGGCRSCALRRLCKGRETRRMDLAVPVPAGAAYTPGDAVRLAYRGANAALAAAVMFLPPLAGLAAGGFLARGEGDGVFLLACLAGAAAGVGASWALSRSAAALKPDVRLLEDDKNDKRNAGFPASSDSTPEGEQRMAADTPLPEEAEIRRRLELYVRDKPFRLNDGDGMAGAVIRAIAKRREKYGSDFCPCRRPSGDAEKDAEIVCPCAFHLEEIRRDGHCHCYLFTNS